jgi:hypothetical protein
MAIQSGAADERLGVPSREVPLSSNHLVQQTRRLLPGHAEHTLLAILMTLLLTATGCKLDATFLFGEAPAETAADEPGEDGAEDGEPEDGAEDGEEEGEGEEGDGELSEEECEEAFETLHREIEELEATLEGCKDENGDGCEEIIHEIEVRFEELEWLEEVCSGDEGDDDDDEGDEEGEDDNDDD